MSILQNYITDLGERACGFSYYDFLTVAENDDCNAALERIFPRIDLPELHAFIDETEYLSDLQKEFYKTYLSARYELILKPVFDKM